MSAATGTSTTLKCALVKQHAPWSCSTGALGKICYISHSHCVLKDCDCIHCHFLLLYTGADTGGGMLISAVMPIMSLYKLRHGEYGYSGPVVNLPQDVAYFTQQLPRLPANLDVLIVRREEANQTSESGEVWFSELYSGWSPTTSTIAPCASPLIPQLCISYQKVEMSLMSCLSQTTAPLKPFHPPALHQPQTQMN